MKPWIVRVFAYLGFHHDDELESWMLRHPEYNPNVFMSEGLILVKFDIPADKAMLREFFEFFSDRKDVELFSMEEIDVDLALMKLHDENPSYTFLGDGGCVSPSSHDELLTTSDQATHQGGDSPSPPALGSSGDVYEYAPKAGVEVEGE